MSDLFGNHIVGFPTRRLEYSFGPPCFSRRNFSALIEDQTFNTLLAKSAQSYKSRNEDVHNRLDLLVFFPFNFFFFSFFKHFYLKYIPHRQDEEPQSMLGYVETRWPPC